MAGEGLTGKQAKKVQNTQRKALPPRGTVNPPPPAVTHMAPDPASASVMYANKMQAERRPQIEAARSVEAARTQQTQAQKELAARADQKAYQRHIEFDQAHGIQPDNQVYGKDDTTLLLNAIGYTGNDMRDFNAQVSRINKVFNQVYGYDPTPGLVLDLVRSPASADPEALRNLLQGTPEQTVTPQQQGMLVRGGVLVQTDEQRAKAGEKAGLDAALRASVFLNDHQPLFAAAQKILGATRDRDLLQRYQIGDPTAGAQLASIVPGPGGVISAVTHQGELAKRFGFMPSQFAGMTWQENQHILDNALGRTTGPAAAQFTDFKNGMATIADWQKRANAKYGLNLKVTGVLDDSWAKAITSLSHTRSYASQLLAQEASNAGFGGSFDSFNAFDESGNFAGNSDGRAAKDAIQRYVSAQKGQTKFLKDHPWWQQVGQNAPLHFFDSGGWSWGSGADWILGGSGNGVTAPWNNPLDTLSDVAGIAEHSLIRGTGAAFSGLNGIVAQGKTDVWAWQAMGNSKADEREVAKRLTESASWLNLFGASKQFTDKHEELDFVTNLVGDLVVMRRFGSPGETIKLNSTYGQAMRDAMTGQDLSLARSLVKRSNYASERVGQMWKWGREGRMGKMESAGDSIRAGDAIAAPEWIVDPESRFGTQFVTKDGQRLRPLEDGEQIREGDQVHSWYDLLHNDMIDKATHENIASWNTIVRQRMLDTWKSPTVPARSTALFQRVQRLGLKGRAPLYTVHPLAFTRGRTWEAVSHYMDWADKSFEDSAFPGTGFLHQMHRTLRVQFTKAANPRELPIAGANPDNIFRMAMDAGMSARKSEAMQRLFIEGRAMGDSARILKATNEIAKAAAEQGRGDVIGGVKNMFAAFVNRAEEHAKFTEATPDELFGKKGLLTQRNWAAFPEAGTTLKNEIRHMGLPTRDVMVNGESHLFVPGISQQEAMDLARDGRVLTPKGELSNGVVRPAKISGESLDSWNVELGKESPVSDETLKSLPFGEAFAGTQHEFIARRLAVAQNEEERAFLSEKLASAKQAPSPTIPEEALQNISVPTLLQRKNNPLTKLTDFLNRIGMIQRRAILTTDPVLLEKHGLTDSLRRVIAEGGPLKVAVNQKYRRDALKWLGQPGNEKMKALYDSLHDLAKNGDYRYDVEGRGATAPAVFWTGGARSDWLHAAAGYVDRRLMSGPYQAWKVGGRSEVRRWFTENPEGIKLAEAEGFPGDEAHVLADMVTDNLGTIQAADPSFLREAEAVRNGAKDVRKALAKYIEKHNVNIPVSGHVPNPVSGFWFNLDRGSNWLIGKYLTANKWNRGGLFEDMTGRLFHDYVKVGTEPQDAMMAAISQAKLINRYHMLDLADALKVEQTFRWGALFFTKHRLYWNWLAQTMRTRPELAVALNDLQGKLDTMGKKFPGQTPGTFTFELPFVVPGTKPAGGKSLYSIPFARLLWMNESSGNPGMASNLIHAGFTGQTVWPGKGAVELTTIDSNINQLAIMAEYANSWLGKSIVGTAVQKLVPGAGTIRTAEGMEKSMSLQDRLRFRGIVSRVQGSYFAEHHRYMDPNDAAAVALQHMFVTGMWRNTAFTGGYVEDPRMTTEQDAVWKRYNEEPSPQKREALRQANPWIDNMLGVYYSTPKQHTLGQQLWNQYSALRAEHEQRQDALLADFKAHPDHIGDLFGKNWNAEGKRYGDAITQLEDQAKTMGANDWLTQFKGDHFAQIHKLFAAQLHQMYGIPLTKAEHIAKGGRPSWVQQYRDMLNGPLSEQTIATLPPEDQQSARETAATYRAMIRPWNKEPSTEADTLRNKYFTSVYGPWVTRRDKWFQQAGREDKNDQGRTFDAMRDWMDRQDHPFTVNGIEFPSPIRAHFAMLPVAAQTQYRRNILTKNWGWLSKFDKGLLGSPVDQTVQDGWTYYNKTIYDAIGGPQGTIHQKGVHPQIDDIEALKYAQYVDKQYPGFLQDYVQGLTPVYSRLGSANLGKTAGARSTWQTYFGKVAQIAGWYADVAGAAGVTEGGQTFKGNMGPINHDPAYMAVRASLFRKQIWGDLMQTGRQGVYNGTPLARVPDDEYPQGGVLYQMAMAQPNRDFRQEFRQWLIADPNFLYKLFSNGG